MNSYHEEVGTILDRVSRKEGSIRKFIYASRTKDQDGKQDGLRVLDVGCGVGNTTIPLLESNPRLFVYSCDFSTHAIETLRLDSRLIVERCCPFVWDIAGAAVQNMNKKKLLKLCCGVAKHKKWLQQLANCPSVQAFATQNMMLNDANTLLVVIYELLLGQWKCKHPSSNRREAVFDELKRILNKVGLMDNSTVSTAFDISSLPRYVRVNTIRSSLQSTLQCLEKDGWQIRRLKKNITPKNYRRLVSKLATPNVYIDPHIDNLLIFPQNVDLHEAKLFLDGSLILQDKASCLSAFVLQPVPGSSAMDVCAAPGMKTTHMAALMRNKGRIWAFDRDRQRATLMSQMIAKAGTNIVHAVCKDFLRVDLSDAKYQKVEYVIVDPPCSGSGMAKRAESFDEEFEKPDEQRIQRLANLQVMLLKHALSLASLRRLVYSTCSVHWVENEGVVLEVLSDPQFAVHFQLVDPLPQWRHRGKLGKSTELELKKCLRASPRRDLTNGFFVALFQRKDLE